MNSLIVRSVLLDFIHGDCSYIGSAYCAQNDSRASAANIVQLESVNIFGI